MKRKSVKTVVLTSRENFVWLSMQEIIPFIERCWLASAKPRRHEVVCLNVDRRSLAELLPELLSADNVVFTCFTTKLCKLGALLRKSVSFDARYFLYLHNQATIACWPFHEWGLGEFLRDDDVFVSSSPVDARTMSLSFVSCRVATVPFTVEGIKSAYRVPATRRTSGPKSRKAAIPFVYAGRLSAQKNLHSLIYSFRFLRDAHPDLEWNLTIYGTDDNLGSPNMGMASKNYGQTLRELARLLGLEDRIAFKGYVERARLNRALSRQRHVSVSASLHSDENFGMAQFRSICTGNLAVLTRWGGYEDFGKRFAGRVFLARARETERGPWVDPAEFAESLSRAAEKYRESAADAKPVAVPRYYLERNIAGSLFRLATENRGTGAPLQKTEFAKRILRKRALFEKQAPGSSRIFRSYSDPDSKTLFRSYQMAAPAQATRDLSTRLRCFPWVELNGDFVAIRDPHRGDLTLPLVRGGATKNSVLVTDWFGQSRRASKKTATRLLSLGYIHPDSQTNIQTDIRRVK